MQTKNQFNQTKAKLQKNYERIMNSHGNHHSTKCQLAKEYENWQSSQNGLNGTDVSCMLKIAKLSTCRINDKTRKVYHFR